MSRESDAAARNFIEKEGEFHLGFLPTEQSNPLTRTMGEDFRRCVPDGIRTLQRGDAPILEALARVFASPEYDEMLATGIRTVSNGGRIVFSGCGATGRLSILLESMWRDYAGHSNGKLNPDSVESIMTGGDFALVRAVESFEDYQVFGRRQVRMANMKAGDMLVAITEGGETSSVIGTVKEAAEQGCRVFLLFNNPRELLRSRLERCREVIDDPRVVSLDLCCGPMSLAGSTRMQATSCEEMVAGAMLETIASGERREWLAELGGLLAYLGTSGQIDAMAGQIEFESGIYGRGGHATYLADDYLLDLFTDTTERTPTFMLPPFKTAADPAGAPEPWAFIKNPLYDTMETWRRMLLRPPRCLEWTSADYREMGAESKLVQHPPRIGRDMLYSMKVGCESCPERFRSPDDVAVLVTFKGGASSGKLEGFRNRCDRVLELSGPGGSPLNLMDHMAVKLALNAISTGTMASMGRVSGNWMSFVNISNKKLIDRSVRLVSELGGVDYATACRALFASIEEIERMPSDIERPSPVQHALSAMGVNR
ncbi:MAG: hypothetical protein MJ025_02735 [Victivallaceae bacterium]|nr:hypothetical protein [Victivallaceae bacterium]